MPVPSGPERSLPFGHPMRSSRRQFLQRAGLLAISAPTLGAALAACSKSGPASSAPTLTIAAPDTPVTWGIAGDNRPTAEGLAPEKGATLQLYT